jgi:hypothetical protein
MVARLKYALPVIHIAVAAFLRHQSKQWITLTRHMDMPGPGPPERVLAFISLPVTVLRGIWWRAFYVYWPDWIFVTTLVVLWYWVGSEIESRFARRTPFAISAQLARVAVDALLTASSLWFIFFNRVHDMSWFPLWYFVPALVFLLAWIFVPPFLLCADLFAIVRTKRVSL